MVPNSKATVKIKWNNNPEFYMHQADTTKKYKLLITDALLHVNVLTPSADLHRTLSPRLKADPVYYHYTESVVLTESIVNIASHYSQNLVKNGATPIRVYIVFIKSDAFRGNYKKSPYDFRYVSAAVIHTLL